MRLPGLFVPSRWDSIYMKSYPALPCRAIGYAVPSGLVASGDLRLLLLRRCLH